MDITFLFISEWLIRIIALFYLTRKRSPDAALAWLLIIFFEPWIGLAIYLLIGSRVPAPKKLNQYDQLIEKLKDNSMLIKPSIQDYIFELSKPERDIAQLVERMGHLPALCGNKSELIANSNAFIDKLIEDINQAQNHLHLLFYIFKSDTVGQRVLTALEQAAARGVKCRLLVDAVGSRHFIRTHLHHARKMGIEVVDAAPVISLKRYFGRVDWRNHRKIAVIDGRIGYTGSQNIAESSYGHADLVWSDLMVRLTGPIVLELQAVFIADWASEAENVLISPEIFPRLACAGDDCLQVLPSGPIYPTENYQRLVISAIYAAKKTVTITTPYFIPDNVFLQAVQVARLRRVEINIIVPDHTDHDIADKASQSYYTDLLNWGVNIYHYQKGVLHPKTMTVDDDLSFFGSSNFDIRSFVLDFEVNMVFYGENESKILRQQQRQYMRDSTLVELDKWEERGRTARIIENIAKLFSPLL